MVEGMIARNFAHLPFNGIERQRILADWIAYFEVNYRYGFGNSAGNQGKDFFKLCLKSMQYINAMIASNTDLLPAPSLIESSP